MPRPLLLPTGRRHGARLALVIAAAWLVGADAAPTTAVDALARLERTGLNLARLRLEKGEALVPYAFVLRSDGRTQRVSPKLSPRQRTAEDVAAALVEGLRSRAARGEYQAVAIFRFVVIKLPGGGESNAIHAGLEHQSGSCAQVYVPYRKPEKSSLEFEPELRRSREAEVFEHCESLP